MADAAVLGGTGAVGAATARALASADWTVTCTGRSAAHFPPDLGDAGVRFVVSDRWDPGQLAAILRNGVDVVVDCAGYTARHARLLLAHTAAIGSVVFVSSKAVYVDDAGRHSNSEHPPHFARPVTENQATLPPSDSDDFATRDGYGRCKAAAEQVYLGADVPVSVLRPSRIHGVGAAPPREWVFVKRALDGRRHVLFAKRGRGANHPTAAANLAALIRFCAEHPERRVLNSADPDAPDGRTIAAAIARQMGHSWQEVLLDDTAPPPLGDHPWNTVPPFLLNTSAAESAGYQPVGSYAETVAAEVDWLVSAAGRLPFDDGYFQRFFDYAAEDAWIAAHESAQADERR